MAHCSLVTGEAATRPLLTPNEPAASRRRKPPDRCTCNELLSSRRPETSGGAVTAPAAARPGDATVLATLRTARAFGNPVERRFATGEVEELDFHPAKTRHRDGNRSSVNTRRLPPALCCLDRVHVAVHVWLGQLTQCWYDRGFITNTLMHHQHQEDVGPRLQPATCTFWVFIHV